MSTLRAMNRRKESKKEGRQITEETEEFYPFGLPSDHLIFTLEYFSSQHGLGVECFQMHSKANFTQRIRLIKQESLEVEVILSHLLTDITKNPIYFHLSTLLSIGSASSKCWLLLCRQRWL